MTKLQLLAGVGVVAIVLSLVWYDLRTKLEILCKSMTMLAEALQVEAQMWKAIAEKEGVEDEVLD